MGTTTRQHEETLTLEDAAEIAGCSTRTVQRALRRGELRGEKRGSRRRIALRRADFESWADGRRHQAQPSASRRTAPAAALAPEQQARILKLVQEGVSVAEIVARERVDVGAISALVEQVEAVDARVAKMRSGVVLSAEHLAELGGWLSGPVPTDGASLVDAIRQTIMGLTRRAELVRARPAVADASLEEALADGEPH